METMLHLKNFLSLQPMYKQEKCNMIQNMIVICMRKLRGL